MKRKTPTIAFGRTWWGRQWLAAFDGIDERNRLHRGERYAGNGSVRGIDIDDSGIRARVQGSRTTPYEVQVALTPFAMRTRERIIETVQNRPVMLARLLNRQLPANIVEVLEQGQIRLFPRDWGDVRAECSCPDDAMPCKHIAAVIYLVAAEIDKNPFLVFALHGMDLAAAVAAATGTEPARLSQPPRIGEAWTQTEPVGEFRPPAADVFAALDLSRVPAMRQRILAILAPEPLFHTGDFRARLAVGYQRAAEQAELFSQAEPIDWPGAAQVGRVCAVIDGHGALVDLLGDGEPLISAAGQRGAGQRLDTFGRYLHGLPGRDDRRLSHPVRLWKTLLHLALKLLEQSACVPVVLADEDGRTLIHWRAALLDDAVRDLHQQLCALCPPDFVVMQSQASLRPVSHYADAGAQLDAALHLFLDHFMARAYRQSAEARRRDPIEQLFFAGRPLLFERFETAEHPNLMQHWLRRLTLGTGAWRLQLRVDDIESRRLAVSLYVMQSDDGDAGSARPVADWLAQTGAQPARAAVLADLATLADYFPEAERLFARDGEDRLVYDLDAFTPIYRDVLPALRMLGIRILLPRALQNMARPRAELQLSSDAQAGAEVSYLNLDQLLDFDWRVAVGEETISAEEFRRLVHESAGIVQVRNQYLMLEADEAEKLLDTLEKRSAAPSATDLLRAGLAGDDGARVHMDEGARELFAQLLEPGEPAPLPAGLRAELRPYQVRGFEWLANTARLGFGSLLADDMGLGKTLQVIALLLHMKQRGELDEHIALVVVPTSLLTNWRREIARFAPALSAHIYHGPDRSLQAETPYDVLLTSYGLVRGDLAELSQSRYRVLVLDEAQNIKNPATAQTRAIKQIAADCRIALSGTPVENRLREYWSVFDFLNPDYLGGQKRFARELANPIERERDAAALDRFRRLTAPFILRRLKTDQRIIADLPDKLQANRYCSLTARQASLYQNTVDTLMQQVDAGKQGIERRGRVFKLLNALKQICNAPEHYLDGDQASVKTSGKLAAFIEIMQEIQAADEKALIFTQYRRMGELLVKALHDELGVQAGFLHGGRNRSQRDALVENFQNSPRERALVLSLKAGGTGLNLTAASQVVHYDLWWNPAVEQQATDRAYRIGQQRNVVVHRLITENTLEERIDGMIQAKKELADLTVASGEQWITELSQAELRELVAL